MGFSDTADRMMWPSSSSRDRKWPRITKCTHSRVVGLRLERQSCFIIYLLPSVETNRMVWKVFRYLELSRHGSQVDQQTDGRTNRHSDRKCRAAFKVTRPKITQKTINEKISVSRLNTSSYGKVKLSEKSERDLPTNEKTILSRFGV